MKEPAPPRSKKPPSPQKLRLRCSFGGAFVPRHPSGELRYVGGESRIISVDRRGIGLSKLVSRLSELCPDCSFSLKYHLPESPSSQPELISISNDEDVRIMVRNHDRLAAHGKAYRLRVFLCDVTPSLAGYVWPRNPTSGTRTGSCSQLGVPVGERKTFDGGDALGDLTARTFGKTCGDSCESLGSKVFRTQITTTHENGIQYFGVSTARSPGFGNPESLNRVSLNGFKEDSVCGVGFDQSGGAASSLGQVDSHDVQSSGPYTSAPYTRKTENYTARNTNRENVFPWKADHATVKTCFAPVSLGNQSYRGVFQSQLYSGSDGHSDLSHCMTKNHQCGGQHNRFHGTGPCNMCGCWIGLNDVAAQQFCDGKFCLPRLSFSKFVVPRAHQTQLTKPINFGSNRGVLREQRLRPMPGQGDLPDVGFEPQKLQGRSVNYNCLDQPDDVGISPSLHSDTMSIRDNLLSKSRIAKPNTHSHAPYRNNPFSDANHCPVQCDESAYCDVVHANSSYDLDNNSGFLEPDKRNNANAALSILSFSYGLLRKDVEEVDVKLRKINMMPQSDIVAKLDDIFEPVESSIYDTSVINLSDIKAPLDLPMHALSLSSATEAHPSAPASSDNSNNLLESDDFAPSVIASPPKDETGLQLNNVHLIEENPFISGRLVGNIAGETSKENAFGPRLLWESSQPLSSLVALVSHGTEKELAYIKQDHETMLSPTYVEEKSDVSGSTSICSKEANETISKVSAVYPHLAMQELQMIKNSDLEEIRELGVGTYGTVFYGKWKGSDVAIKRLKRSCFAGGELGEERMVTDFCKEACLLGQLHHPNVVAFYGVVTDGPVTNLATVTEYMVNGSLKQVLKRKDRTVDRRKRLIIAMDAAFGMEYIHEKNIVHFDLKSHNLLVNMRDPQRPVCKIGDLGLSKVKRQKLVSGGVRGSIPWMAPELLTCEDSMVTEKVDVYSFGIVMWELLTGEEPYENMHFEDIIAGIIKGDLRPEIPTWCDPLWRSLMERCWSTDPASRPSFSEIAKELRAIAASINIK
ncbi:uncharacterized protein LOC120109084 [Phoenix dactylifera]|uniref:Uncharacterized protein LOC103722913 n=1 Tax=Phoenix dactylifera TaxID=42345 RepID=A0A8B8ZZE4_PHODC|nr:uncharacterized protein LOC103722913 [Phoenix dactylifera]XP_038978747.1 uncharacterized protein LOC120109084 [Phoenix dactylifera]